MHIDFIVLHLSDKTTTIMTTKNSNPRNFKLGTVIKTKNATYTVYKKYKNSLLCDVEGETQRFFIEFSMFNNRYFLADLISVVEPVLEVIQEDELSSFSIGVDEGNIVEY